MDTLTAKHLNPDQDQCKMKVLEFLEPLVTRTGSVPLTSSIFLMTGKGGTGKTFTLANIIEEVKVLYPELTITLCAPTWTAVGELEKEFTNSSVSIITLASCLGTEVTEGDNEHELESFRLFNQARVVEAIQRRSPPAIFHTDILVIDESSMLGGNNREPNIRVVKGVEEVLSSDSFKALEYRLAQRASFGYRDIKAIILLADHCQTPPIGAAPDRDAFIIEYLLATDSQNFRLTKSERTDKLDILNVCEVFRNSIELANHHIAKGCLSNAVVIRNLLPYSKRISSENITYTSNMKAVMAAYKEKFLEAVERGYDAKYCVWVNYNRFNHPYTQNAIFRLRELLYGKFAPKFVENELLILLKSITLTLSPPQDSPNAEPIEVKIPNEARIFVKEVKETTITLEREYREGKYKQMPLKRMYEFKVHALRVIIPYKNTKIITTLHILKEGQLEACFGAYDKQTRKFVKVFKNSNKVLETPYGLYLMFKKAFNEVCYGYIVNTHKIQGGSYSHVFIDEQNIFDSPTTNKNCHQLLYTALSRARMSLTIYNSNNL